ncbi:hypothetical protein BaRGS_00018210 [Batillaria attramentaria]|uniref:Uncharacterized protein n=1 Tax=Batillaria attramentaria TaxID=370345 RepID=A0ABD0KTS4_9CAEN
MASLDSFYWFRNGRLIRRNRIDFGICFVVLQTCVSLSVQSTHGPKARQDPPYLLPTNASDLEPTDPRPPSSSVLNVGGGHPTGSPSPQPPPPQLISSSASTSHCFASSCRIGQSQGCIVVAAA